MSLTNFKKLFFLASTSLLFALFVGFIPFTSHTAHAQIAVPVMEIPGSPLYLNTLSIMGGSAANSWNTAVIAAKETGYGLYTPPGASVPVPLIGAEIAATGGTSADALAMAFIKPLIQNFTNSVVEWINSGFQGGPLFVTDPGKFFIGVADRTAESFLMGTDLEFLCSPFALKIRLALNLNYSAAFRDQIKCTWTGVANNMENFIDSFDQGGWKGWFSLTQNSQNNPYGSYLQAQSQLDIRLGNMAFLENTQLNWGKGFISWRDCAKYANSNSLGGGEVGACVEYGDVKTPGTVIESQLEGALGSNLRQLELANEFDQIAAALVNQLMKQVIMEAGGLLGNNG